MHYIAVCVHVNRVKKNEHTFTDMSFTLIKHGVCVTSMSSELFTVFCSGPVMRRSLYVCIRQGDMEPW